MVVTFEFYVWDRHLSQTVQFCVRTGKPVYSRHDEGNNFRYLKLRNTFATNVVWFSLR